MTLIVIATLLVSMLHQGAGMDPGDMASIYFKHSGAAGTQHGKKENASDWYTSNSYVPHLPSVSGFMGTHGTYRFLTVHEQTAILIGDGKHGIWRIQENGMVREYRKAGRIGLLKNTNPNNLNPNGTAGERAQLDIIEQHYAAYIPEEGWGGYKYPDQKMSPEGYQNFIDLTIYHPKFKGKYDNHVPIDLPHWYCTMTSNDYPHVYNAWKYATAQPRANQMGPLAIRAGMDIKEQYHNILRFDFMSDAGVWANVGVGNVTTDKVVTDLNAMRSRVQTINYQQVDLEKVDVELYLFERPFFNKPYIFITMVLDIKNKSIPSPYSYVRNHGPYFEELKKRFPANKIPSNPVNHFPPAYTKNYPNAGDKSTETVYGLPVYGHHHPRRHAHEQAGGACPNRGGDWGRYPWSNGGSGFPTNYEEVTPACDGFVIDMKMYLNLQVPTWQDKALFQGNGGFPGQLTVDYTADVNIYGQYTDPWLLSQNATNPYQMNLAAQIIEKAPANPVQEKFKLKFSRLGKLLGYNKISVPPKKPDPKPDPVVLGQDDINKLVNKLSGIVDGVTDIAKKDANKPTTAPKKEEPKQEDNFFGGAAGFDSQDAGYIIICCYIVFTMQSGFALLESGFCSARSVANIMAKNMIDVALGGIVYWFIGYGFSFGANSKPTNRMAGEGFFIIDVALDGSDIGHYISYIFHCSFATATATMTSGAVAERIKLTSYIIFAMIDTSMIYPICCHWVWHPEGVFYKYVLDFSGSAVVHMCGGASALAGAIALGPRLGRFKKGNEKYYRPSNYTSLVLGTFMLWWGWLGFNGGAQMVMSGDKWKLVGRILVCTLNAAMGGAASTIIMNLLLAKKRGIMLDIGEVCAGLLGGLVAICAPCANIHPWEGLVIGAIAGPVTIGFVHLTAALKIDDPVGAFAVHWGAGLWGVIAAAFFADGLEPSHNGIFRGGTGEVLGWNILLALTITVWSFGVSYIIFMGLKYTIGLRISEEEEILGLDVVDHNVNHDPYDFEGYRDFVGKRKPAEITGEPNHAIDMEPKQGNGTA